MILCLLSVQCFLTTKSSSHNLRIHAVPSIPVQVPVYYVSSMSLSILFDPVQEVGQLGVDARVLRVPAADAPGDDAALHPRGGQPGGARLLLAHERAARVALARVL